MEDKREGMMLVNLAVAVFAGTLSSILVLIVTHGFSIGDAYSEPGRALAGDHAVIADPMQDTVKSVSAETAKGGNELTLANVSKVIMQLQGSVAEAAKERAQLAATIVDLNRQLAEIEANVINQASLAVNHAADEDDLASSEAIAGIDSAGRAEGFRGADSAERQFESLLAAGLDEQSARDLQLRADQYQLARLELFDQATREGWADTDQLDDRLESLNENQPDLRNELGETAYDRYLYESGRPNRVSIASIISGSAADLAGVKTGDQIFTYGDERIFSVQDLQDATRAGNRGEYITLLVDRNGEIQRSDIERGPMGVTLQSSRQQP